MSKAKRARRPRSITPPDRASNPTIPLLHALAAMGDERWEEAITALQRFLEMENRPANRQTAYQNLTASYLALERFDEALAASEKVARLAPDDPDFVHGRGVIYACAGRISEAIDTFELFARRWPQQASRYEMSDALRQLQRMQNGELPVGDYLASHLQEQISHNVELGDWHIVERKARRMIAANPQSSRGPFRPGCRLRGTEPLPGSIGSLAGRRLAWPRLPADAVQCRPRLSATGRAGAGAFLAGARLAPRAG